MRRIRIVAAVVGALLVAAACSGDDDDGAADSESDPATEAGALGDPDGTDPLPPLPDEVALPIVFVHGFAGSAQQYESQAMRFVANGYPQERIVAYDHDGAGVDIAAYTEGLAEVVDATLAEHGVEQVYLVGHSRGTGVSTAYLADPDRAEKVAKYVAIDGAPCVDGRSVPRPDPGRPPRPGARRGGDVGGVVRPAVRVPRGRGAGGRRHRPAAGSRRDLGSGRQASPPTRVGRAPRSTSGRSMPPPATGSATSRTPPSSWVRTARSVPSSWRPAPTTSTCSAPRAARCSTTCTCSPTCGAATWCGCSRRSPTEPPDPTPTWATTTPR